MRTLLFIIILVVIAAIVVGWSASRPARAKRLTSDEKVELNAARDLLATLHRSASEVSNEQPFGYIVLDEINMHNRKVRELDS